MIIGLWALDQVALCSHLIQCPTFYCTETKPHILCYAPWSRAYVSLSGAPYQRPVPYHKGLMLNFGKCDQRSQP
ncbi:hypothetical protein FVEN_g13204 [Fusarium venenatum]|nr:hypothetical protein FVEN_g13204 [Fusarium venenatum]